MGFFSKLKKLDPGRKLLKKAIKHDPLASKLIKKDPLMRKVVGSDEGRKRKGAVGTALRGIAKGGMKTGGPAQKNVQSSAMGKKLSSLGTMNRPARGRYAP